MKPLTPPQPEPQSDPGSVIDTSKMSAGQRAALETAEAAREEARENYAGTLFLGRPAFDKLFPFPAQTIEDQDQGDAFIARLDAVLAQADPDQIDRDGEIPSKVISALAEIGAFGIKIPARFGGLGLSQINYSRAAMKLGAFCGNITALLSAHQSIGVPQPLLMFGTEAQKEKFLPRCAGGEISAFALTEPDAGSDPARLKTTATPSEDRSFFLLNGEKLWCTNGTRAGVLVVMARTAVPAGSKASARAPITAFIVDADAPGVEVVHRCRFMGLRALYNGVIRFRDVKVPRENILLGEGKGLRVALSTLNVGRITLPAACAGLSSRCLEISRRWASEREQWGSLIGFHAAIADKLARMSAQAFAIESLVLYVSAMADRKEDVRLEAALAKMWASERAWEIVNDTMQIRGGRGYETAASLRARGEQPEPVERFLRDARINTIFEGSSEIMRLFIAREALDPHLKAGAPLLDSRRPLRQRLRSFGGAIRFYIPHVATLLWPFGPKVDAGPFKSEAREIARLSRMLGRALLAALARFGPKLDREQLVLGRLVEAGAELMAASAAVSRAVHLMNASKGDASPQASESRNNRPLGHYARPRPQNNYSGMTKIDGSPLDLLVRYFCQHSFEKTRDLLRHTTRRSDAMGYRVAKRMMERP
ncbi:MAG: acyl-CoA dehydrogenase family protein [Verrucomicrobiales bacterium]